MSNEIKVLLDEEIKSTFQQLGNLNPGSKEKTIAVDDLVKLYKLKIEETKSELDSKEKSEISKYNERLERDKLAEQVKDRYFKVGIAAAEIILPLVFYAVWMRRGFKFEENGTYTSTTFRGLFNHFRPTKR